jgi:hypothetical protein
VTKEDESKNKTLPTEFQALNEVLLKNLKSDIKRKSKTS